MTKRYRISIIGGGSLGTSFFNRLVEGARQRVGRTLAVTLHDPLPLGPGLPYQQDSDAVLLNSPAAYSSAIDADKEHFCRWLVERGYGTLEQVRSRYFPRAVYGDYLREFMSHTIALAGKLGIEVAHRAFAAESIMHAGDGFRIGDSEGHVTYADHVVLCVGNPPSARFAHLRGRPGFFDDPYPTTKLAPAISPHQRVLVLGTSLSFIDAALALHEAGHRGHIHATSRSGRLPVVKADSLAFVRCTEFSRMAASTEQVTLARLREAVAAEYFLNGGSEAELPDAFRDCSQGALNYLNEEIDAATHEPRIWYSVALGLMTSVENLWGRLSERDRADFSAEFDSKWKMRRISFPLANAKKIRELLSHGALSIAAGFQSVRYDQVRRVFVLNERHGDAIHEREFDAVIDATGFGTNVAGGPTPLFASMLATGMGAADPLGGFRVNPGSGLLVNTAGKDEQISVLGTLACGAYFWTNSLDVNVRIAARQASRLLAFLSNTPMASADEHATARLTVSDDCL
ncbi:FAD/NAD(P)-binding protein [Caballeronia sp. LP003]|uniref:FAD/NAD(P)-binding protein n=1 Tax=Caballeronia sp. LP003 TaxID=3038551 RepID=UPI002855D337|nr:FAD/NAD(P)-binding protein [Caballeronia sp. LP003]MDR5785498.1 FAD/NAD(P)-binding protein [Caballeronia sp. LP003]